MKTHPNETLQVLFLSQPELHEVWKSVVTEVDDNKYPNTFKCIFHMYNAFPLFSITCLTIVDRPQIDLKAPSATISPIISLNIDISSSAESALRKVQRRTDVVFLNSVRAFSPLTLTHNIHRKKSLPNPSNTATGGGGVHIRTF